MLYLDIPSHSDIVALATHRNDLSVSIYLPTTPLSQEATADSIQLKTLAKEAIGKLNDAGADKKSVAAIEEQLEDLVEDYEFWRFQAHGLAVLATPENVRTFRVPNALSPVVVLADRFFLKPLLRSVHTDPHPTKVTLDGGNDRTTDAELAAAARPVLDGLNQEEIAALGALFATREPQARATTDIAQAARAATLGAVDTLLVDIDEVVPGTVDETSGRVDFAEGPTASAYGVVDEIARRVILSGGRVLGVRKADIPRGKPLAAFLRYAV
jgi:hypothetical protein